MDLCKSNNSFTVGCSKCTSLCGKRLPCGHDCLRICGAPCEPCTAPCSNQCQHSYCGQQLDIMLLCAALHEQLQTSKMSNAMLANVCTKCQGISVPVLQFQGCKCIVSVEEADLHIQGQISRKQQYTCPKCSCRLSANSCFRYARELKEQVIFNERIKFSKLLINGSLIDLQYNVLKQAEDDLAKIMKMKGKKKDTIVIEITEILHLVIMRLNTEFYNQLGIMKWQAMHAFRFMPVNYVYYHRKVHFYSEEALFQLAYTFP
ncbi:unnamed protein product [Onchocerca flexuosa]|uniref:RING-type domain-containing protein n=1 Tax=Onchocerca flexuosa TaxID=387005 RepID=A0A183HG99_9BILA|nr:unnamed protein product [Onchocerca flexuosa]